MFKKMCLLSQRSQIKKHSTVISEDDSLVIYQEFQVTEPITSTLLFEIKESNLQSKLDSVFKNINLEEINSWGGCNFSIINYLSNFKKVKFFICKISNYYGYDTSLRENDDRVKEPVLRLKFAENMFSAGFKLNETLFNPKNYTMNSAEFLSCFEKTENADEIENSKVLLIQYLHYALLKDASMEFSEYYKKFDEEGAVFSFEKLPYDYSIVKICYDYYKTQLIPDCITTKIEQGLNRYHFEEVSGLFVMQDKFNFEIIEEDSKTITYSNGFKIYKKPSDKFSTFIEKRSGKDNNYRTMKLPINFDNQSIVDFYTGNYIGYQMKCGEFKKWNSIYDFSITSQRNLFKYVEEIELFFAIHNNDYNCEYESGHVGKSLFNIEKTLLFKGDSLNNIDFSVLDLEDLYNLKNDDTSLLKEQITVILFKLLDKYITKKYGKLSSKKDYMAINDVRYLPPRLVNEFINYCLGYSFNLGVATKERIEFLDYNMWMLDENTVKDKRFCKYSYSDAKDFIFDFELDGIKLEKDTTSVLPDGRKVVMFSRSKEMWDLKEYYDKRRDSIHNKLGFIEDSNVHLIKVSFIINSKRLNSNGFYNICGYITEPIQGTQMSFKTLKGLSNRDFLKVVGYLFTKFEKSFIPLETITMTENFEFYIDYFKSSFYVASQNDFNIVSFGKYTIDMSKLGKSKFNTKKAFTLAYIFKTIKSMLAEGYNPNSFIGIDFSIENFSRNSILGLADSMTEYCNEHEIFFEPNNKYCPVCNKTRVDYNTELIQNSTLVFEDSFACHYRLKNGIFKKYKGENNDLGSKINKAVQYSLWKEEGLIDGEYNPAIVFSDIPNFFQDCFYPTKNVVDGNNKFVGYIYNNEAFVSDGVDLKSCCIDLNDQNNIQNLLRIKGLLRLILQVQRITSLNYGFSKNPFTYVFLNLAHKKQVQILNAEFLTCCNEYIENTKKWTCDYILEVLKSDNSIYLDYNNIGKDLDSLLTSLQYYASKFTKYCSIHKTYYEEKYMCCPLCIKPGEENFVKSHSKIEFGSKFKPINEGGEALIYSYNNGSVIKIFKSEKINYDLKMVVLHRILRKRDTLETYNSQECKFKYIYPRKLVKMAEENTISGYIMEKVENAYPISNLRDKVEIEKIGLTNQDIFEILITMGEGIETLHKEGIFVGDLNGRNILFDKNKNVYFLDFDGMGVDEISPEFCTAEYIDPVSKKNQNITERDDWYSFAVQVFYYLTYTHPFNGIYYENNGKRKVKLNIIDKMEKRISLLGNHGMTPPEIARSWDWMTTELKTAFLNIFEGDLRESIVPYLRNQYDILFLNEAAENFSSIYRVNQKFIAKEVKHFNTEIAYVVNSIAAVSKKDFIEIITDEVKNIHKEISFIDINPAYCNDKVKVIDDVKVSDDGNYAYIIFNSSILVIMDLQKKNLIYKVNASSISNLIVNGSTCYFKYYLEDNGNVESKDLIGYKTKKINILEDGTAKEEVFEIGGEELLCFNAMFNTKFVLIKKMGKSDAIYCNSEVFSKIKYNTGSEVRDYKILYDDITKIWVVINNLGKGVIIYQTGKGDTIEELSDYINNENLKNIEFYKGNLYIPNDDYICIFSVLTKKMKKMSCTKVITSNSILCNMKSLGFSVITDCCYYNVRKG